MALTACNGFSGNSPDSRSLSEWKRDTKERAAETSKIIQAEQAGHLSPGADHSACDKALQKAIQAEAESESADTRERAKRANDKVREALKQAKDCAKGGREKAAANRVAHEAGRIAEQAREIAAQVKNEAEVRKKYYEELSPGNSAGKQSAGKHPAIDKALKTAEEVETEADKIKAEMESADTESKASALLKRAKAARSKIEDAYISLLRF